MTLNPDGPPLAPLQRYRAHARELVLRNRYDLAEPIIRKVLSLAPDDPDANRQLASCLMRRNLPDDALQQARRAVSVKPASYAAHTILGTIYARRGEHESALSSYAEALRLKPRSLATICCLADSSQQLNRWSDSLSWTSIGLAIDAAHCGLLRLRAIALAESKQTDAAIETMQQFMRSDPDSGSSHSAAGSTLRLLGRLDEAADHLRKALEIDPANPETHKVFGYLRLAQNKFPDAQHHFEQALALQPNMRLAISGLKKVKSKSLWLAVKAAAEGRQFDLAEEALRNLIDLDPGQPLPQCELVRSVLLQRRYDQALELGMQLIDRFPQEPRAHHVLSWVYGEREEHDAALRHCDEAIRLAPGNTLHYLAPAAILVELEKYNDALAMVERGLAVKADDQPLRRQRAICLAGLGKEAEAATAIAELARSDTNEKFYQLTAGRFYLIQQRYDRAERHYRRALEIDSGLQGPKGGLGIIYFEQGRFDEAEPFLIESLQINPYSRRARGALAAIAASRTSSS